VFDGLRKFFRKRRGATAWGAERRLAISDKYFELPADLLDELRRFAKAVAGLTRSSARTTPSFSILGSDRQPIFLPRVESFGTTTAGEWSLGSVGRTQPS
jgi:hypothetical protein